MLEWLRAGVMPSGVILFESMRLLKPISEKFAFRDRTPRILTLKSTPRQAPSDKTITPSMPEAIDPSAGEQKLPLVPAPIGRSPDLPPDHDPWEPAPPPNLWQRWRRGWRLVLLLAILVAAYGKWRGGRDYAMVKEWRARRLAAAALEPDRNTPGQAAALLGKAALLAPHDPVVMRAMADFCEPRQDLMAIYALRQVLKAGPADPAVLERLCRLALDWGHPELADGATLQEWASAPAASLALTPLRLSAVWLASRGQSQEGEARLRQALTLAAGTPEALSLEIALSRLLLKAASQSGSATAAEEPLRRLSSVAYSPSAPLALRAESTRLLAGLLLHPTSRSFLTPVRADLLREAFLDLSRSVTDTDPAAAIEYQLSAVSVDLAATPGRRDELVRSVLEKAASAPLDDRLATARWLNENGFPKEALALCEANPGEAGQADWFTAQIDALYELGELDRATQLLAAPSQPLPPHLQQLFLYRLEKAAGRDEKSLAERRRELEQAAAQAQPNEMLSVATSLEKSGDPTTALPLYSSLKNHPQAGLSARLGMVRCLEAMPDKSLDLIQALEDVLQLWPQSEQARNDLAYLHLLAGNPTAVDLESAVSLHAASPWFLPFRITAALRQLHQKDPSGALALLQAEPVRWERVRPGWQAVYAAILAANGKISEAKEITLRLADAPLRPEERKLMGPDGLPTGPLPHRK